MKTGSASEIVGSSSSQTTERRSVESSAKTRLSSGGVEIKVSHDEKKSSSKENLKRVMIRAYNLPFSLLTAKPKISSEQASSSGYSTKQTVLEKRSLQNTSKIPNVANIPQETAYLAMSQEKAPSQLEKGSSEFPYMVDHAAAAEFYIKNGHRSHKCFHEQHGVGCNGQAKDVKKSESSSPQIENRQNSGRNVYPWPKGNTSGIKPASHAVPPGQYA
ncbi:hypothetical protein [Candidatus Fukatsuia endosymbiont of Tuberolachnus salignus]